MGRALRTKRVPDEPIELMMGHIKPAGRSSVTSIYAPYDPDYCRDAVGAIDEIMTDLQKHTSRRIIPVQTPKLVVVAG
jgi:hypothetical protein